MKSLLGAKTQMQSTLKITEELFALEYLRNGHNATAAYKAAHPKCKNDNTAAVQAHRLLRKPKIAAFIQQEQKARKKRLRMEADEALEGITRHARADIGDAFGKDGRLMAIKDMPADVRDAIKSIKQTPSGPVIVMYDKLKARELMAIAGGELKQKHQHELAFDHAKYLADEPPDE